MARMNLMFQFWAKIFKFIFNNFNLSWHAVSLFITDIPVTSVVQLEISSHQPAAELVVEKIVKHTSTSKKYPLT